MNILVLGSEGQIGKPFCKHAESKGHTVDKYDKKISPEFEDLSMLDDLGFRRLSERIRRADVVVFLAFEVGGSKFLQKTDQRFAYISENVALMDNTFSALAGTSKPFLFASSQMANMHHTNYGFLKDLGERYCRSLKNSYICRFWNVYGWEDPQDPKSHVITDFIHMAKQNRTIQMRTNGQEARQFLYVDDCSKALLHWCEKQDEYNNLEYIDITTHEWVSIYEVATEIQKLIPCNIVPGEAFDNIQRGIRNEPSDYVLRFWKPTISLQEGIKKLI